MSPRYETPPGTPPPPYQLGSTKGTKKNSFEVGIRDKDTRLGKQVYRCLLHAAAKLVYNEHSCELLASFDLIMIKFRGRAHYVHNDF